MAAAMPGLAGTGNGRAADTCITGRNGTRVATAGNCVAAVGNVAMAADGMTTGGTTIEGMAAEVMTTDAIITAAMTGIDR